jgi:hypothetical protein
MQMLRCKKFGPQKLIAEKRPAQNAEKARVVDDARVPLLGISLPSPLNLSSVFAQMYAQTQLAYAPTPYSYTPSNSLTATINLDQVRNILNSNRLHTADPSHHVGSQACRHCRRTRLA